MKVTLSISERTHEQKLLSGLSGGTKFYFPDIMGSNTIPNFDDAGGIFRLRVSTPLKVPPAGKAVTVTIDGRVEQNRSDRRVALPGDDLALSVRPSDKKMVTLGSCNTGDVFYLDDLEGKCACWLVAECGTRRTYINVKTGEEKSFDDDERHNAWVGNAVTWTHQM